MGGPTLLLPQHKSYLSKFRDPSTGTPRVTFDSGKDPRYPTGQLPPALKRAAPRHNPPAPLGAWSLEFLLDKWIVNCEPDNQVRKEKRKGRKGSKEMTRALRIGSWNVRTTRTGLSDDLRDINDISKTAVIDCELLRLNIDIAALQETRLPDSVSLKEEFYTFFWQEKSREEPREHGATSENKDQFYEQLDSVVKEIPTLELHSGGP
ncbi:hypothetical protein Bbelb_313070 [Branchiostoma belcheri]|nr:hypothetical protein Bbelb_313070 [Branchiostoma belcheri]